MSALQQAWRCEQCAQVHMRLLGSDTKKNTTTHTNTTTPPTPTTTPTPTMYICICMFMPVAVLAQVAQLPISISHIDTLCNALHGFGEFPSTGRTRMRNLSSSCKASVDLQAASHRLVRVQVPPRGSLQGRRRGEADLHIQDRSAQLVLQQYKNRNIRKITLNMRKMDR